MSTLEPSSTQVEQRELPPVPAAKFTPSQAHPPLSPLSRAFLLISCSPDTKGSASPQEYSAKGRELCFPLPQGNQMAIRRKSVSDLSKVATYYVESPIL